MKTILTIAGSDSSGGAGIQADLKTFQALGLYGMSAITAITAQNTLGVQASQVVDSDLLEAQIRSVLDDIRPDAVKIGMLGNEASIKVIADLIQEYQLENIVLDPVMVSTSGSRLLEGDSYDRLTQDLFPLVSLITPNLYEAESLLKRDIQTETDMEEAGNQAYQAFSVPVLIKGGHLKGAAKDLLVTDGGSHWFEEARIDNPNTHGTGCTLSSAIASNLALGYSLLEAVEKGKAYVTGAIKAGLDLGQGRGPLNHSYGLKF